LELILLSKAIIKEEDSFKIRGEIEEEVLKNDRSILIIKSIPYQINKSVLVERIAQLAREKKIEGISDIRDESNREGIRVVIELRKGIEVKQLEDNFINKQALRVHLVLTL
jgi:DNA gyrase subunit A